MIFLVNEFINISKRQEKLPIWVVSFLLFFVTIQLDIMRLNNE